MFPAPLEVDRELYFSELELYINFTNNKFPAPREVDREIYSRRVQKESSPLCYVSGPSRGR